jgi:antitoxin component of MazEF toxin-antitoxin module
MGVTMIKLWGECPSIRLKKSEMEKANIKIGDILETTVLNGSIILKRKQPKSLDELFDNKVGDYKFEEISWGKPCGDEAW